MLPLALKVKMVRLVPLGIVWSVLFSVRLKTIRPLGRVLLETIDSRAMLAPALMLRVSVSFLLEVVFRMLPLVKVVMLT